MCRNFIFLGIRTTILLNGLYNLLLYIVLISSMHTWHFENKHVFIIMGYISLLESIRYHISHWFEIRQSITQSRNLNK